MRAQLNLPNTLTLVRILLVPIVLIGLLRQSDSGDVVAAAAFAIASTTDWFDGYLARSRGLVTTFGKVMDPIADKLLITWPSSATTRRRALTANSRTSTIPVAHQLRRSSADNVTSVVVISSLSAIGSITLPKVVTRPRERAR